MPGPRLVLAGYYGHGNAGDEAILTSLLASLTAAVGGLRVTVVSGDPPATRTRHDVDAVGDTDIAGLVDAVAKSDAVVLGGGGLLQDYWDVGDDAFLTRRHGGLVAYLAYPALARLLGKPAVLGAIGVGPLTTERGRHLARVIAELAPVGTVRDAASLRLLGELGGAVLGEGIGLAADPAFLLPTAARPAVDEVLAAAGVGPDEPLLGVALRPWTFAPAADGWEEEVAEALAADVSVSRRRVLLLPFHLAPGDMWADDRRVHARVTTHLGGRCEVVDLATPAGGFDPGLLAGLIARCERILAMRFHACLFALRARVPLAALAYDPKVTELLASAGLDAPALPPAAWRRQPIAGALAAASALAAGSPIESFVREQQARAQRTIDVIRRALAGPRPVRSPAARFLDQALLAKALAVERLEELVRTSAEPG